MNPNQEHHVADELAEHRNRNERAKLAEAAQKLDLAKAQRAAVIEAHTSVLREEQQADATMVTIIVQAAIKSHGSPKDTEAFAAAAEELAHRLGTARRRRQYGQLKELLDGLNAREPNEVLVLAAKRAGVELSVASEASKLVTG